MNYKNKGYCECCNAHTWVRSDKIQGVVCKGCDEPVVKFNGKKKQFNTNYEYESFEMYSRPKRAV